MSHNTSPHLDPQFKSLPLIPHEWKNNIKERVLEVMVECETAKSAPVAANTPDVGKQDVLEEQKHDDDFLAFTEVEKVAAEAEVGPEDTTGSIESVFKAELMLFVAAGLQLLCVAKKGKDKNWDPMFLGQI